MGRIHPLTIICTLAALSGFAFAAVSTSDFVAHLDRQVHGIHCSFLPGLSEADVSGASGCHATLMSPYSSVFRSSIWGGIPVALPGMAVFSFLGFWVLWLWLNQRQEDESGTGFLFAGSLVPLATSGFMGYLSLVELDAACKLCIGIYASSAVLSLSSFLLWRRALRFADIPKPPRREGEAAQAPGITAPSAPLPLPTLGLAFAAGLTCVAISLGAYAAAAPDFSKYVGSCGSIPQTKAAPGVIIPYGKQRENPVMLEVIDPLCPSCKGFESRFSKMPIADSVDRKLLLFPLDESCNWMIDRSIHPGACSISEAVLCSSDPEPVLLWAFENQAAIMAASEKDPKAAATMAKQRFPALSECIGSPEAGAKVNQSLRWAVKNRLPILTPQVFVEGTRLCGEDTDLGLDYALPRLIEHTKNQPRPKSSMVEEEDDQEEAPPPIRQAPRKKLVTPQAKEKTSEEAATQEEEKEAIVEPTEPPEKAGAVEPEQSPQAETTSPAEKSADDGASPAPPPPSPPSPSTPEEAP